MIVLIFLLLFHHTQARALRERYLLNVDALRELDSWELKLLRDFVRGKGRGSVSRLPIEQLLSEKEPPLMTDAMLDPNDPNVVKLGGVYAGEAPMVVHQPRSSGPSSFIMPTSIIAPASYNSPLNINRPEANMQSNILKPMSRVSLERPQPTIITQTKSSKRQKPLRIKMKAAKPVQQASKTVHEEPTLDSFKELAGLFQTFIDRRQPLVSSSGKPPSSKQSGMNQRSIAGAQSTYSMGQWEPMDSSSTFGIGDEEEPMGQPPFLPKETGQVGQTMSNGLAKEATKEEWETKMKELSEQLSSLLMQIKHTKEKRPARIEPLAEKPRAKVTILRNGSAEQMPDGRYEFVATLTLIQDEGQNILVDTGLGTDINGRTTLLSRLSDAKLAPPNIHVVVTTHGHPDHAGGIADFPDAVHYQGWYQHHHTLFNLSGLFESDHHQLSPRVTLIRSPGHTSDDIAVLVSEEVTMGSVVIAGDTFLRKEDIDYPMMWQPLSSNETQQYESRRRLICGSSRWIVPGHGPPFPITQTIRNSFRC